MTRIIKQDVGNSVLLVDEFNNSESEDCRCVILSSRDVTIIRAAIWPFLTWRTRLGFWVQKGLFQLADLEEWYELQSTLALLDYKLTGEMMSNCFDSLASSLSEIAAAIARISVTQNCGTGGNCGGVGGFGGYVGFLEDGTPITGTVPGVNGPGEGQWPEGFASLEEYQAHLCKVANWLVDTLIYVLRQLGGVSIFEATLLATFVGLVLGGVIANVPGAIIGSLVSALIALSGVIGVLYAVADYIEDNHDDVVCAVYNSDTFEAALESVLQYVDEALIVFGLTANLHWAVKAIVSAVFATDAVNKLFQYGLAFNYPDVDCSTCNGDVCQGEAEKDSRFGTGLEDTYTLTEIGNDITLTSVTNTAFGYLGAVRFRNGETICARRLTNIAHSGGSAGYCQIRDEADTELNAPGESNITLDNLATVNAWLASEKPLVHGFNYSGFNAGVTFGLTFEDSGE